MTICPYVTVKIMKYILVNIEHRFENVCINYMSSLLMTTQKAYSTIRPSCAIDSVTYSHAYFVMARRGARLQKHTVQRNQPFN